MVGSLNSAANGCANFSQLTGLFEITVKAKKSSEAKMSTTYKLQTPVYDILPPTTTIFDYAIGLWKTPSQWFSVGAQMVLASQEATQMMLRIFVTATDNACTSPNKTKVIQIMMKFIHKVDLPNTNVCFLNAMLIPVFVLKHFTNLTEGSDSMGCKGNFGRHMHSTE